MPAAGSATREIEGQDRAAVTHLVVSCLHLGLGAILTLLALAARAFPDAFTGALSYGRVRPMAMTSVMIGWLAVALIGAVYQILPRLTGTALWNEPVATAGAWLLGGAAALGVVLVGAGLGDGTEPLGLPWWLDLVLAVVLLVPLAVTVQTVRGRSETGVFPTLWFVVVGVVSLPVLAFAAAVPTWGGVREALQSVTFASGFTTLWVMTVGTGIGYYVAVRATGNPLANRQLARAGCLSLIFAGIWAGPAQIAFGPHAAWLGPVAASLTLALPVAALANGLAMGTTVDNGWSTIRERPALGALAAAIGFSLVTAVATSAAAFESASAMLGLTAFWDGIQYLSLFGVGGMFVAAWAYQTLPAMTGRSLADPVSVRRQVRWTVWFVGATGLLLLLSGVTAGVGATAGAFSALGPEAWDTVTSTARILAGLAALTGVGGLAAQLLLVLNVYRTFTSGRATEQEVLVVEETV